MTLTISAAMLAIVPIKVITSNIVSTSLCRQLRQKVFRCLHVLPDLGFATKGWEPPRASKSPRAGRGFVFLLELIPVSVDRLNELTLEALIEFASQETDMYLYRIGAWVGVDVHTCSNIIWRVSSISALRMPYTVNMFLPMNLTWADDPQPAGHPPLGISRSFITRDRSNVQYIDPDFFEEE